MITLSDKICLYFIKEANRILLVITFQIFYLQPTFEQRIVGYIDRVYIYISCLNNRSAHVPTFTNEI